MFKTIAGGAALALAFTALSTFPAHATHPVVEGKAQCNTKTGLYDTQWRTGGDPGYPDATATVISQSFNTDPSFVGDEYAGSEVSEWADGPSLAPGASRTLDVTVHFSTHAPGDNVTNSFTLTTPNVGCEKEEPPKVKKATLRLGKVKKCDPAKADVFVKERKNVKSVSIKRGNTHAWMVKAEAVKNAVFKRNGKPTLKFMVNTRPSGGQCSANPGS